MYDVCIIGAGVNGCALSYYLQQSGQKVALLDQKGIAAGGSGAAGAFISPKFSKGGELKELMQTAYLFSLDFYAKHFPSTLVSAPLLHIAKDDQDTQRVISFKENTTLEIANVPLHVSASLTTLAKESESVYLLQGGVVDAKQVCQMMAEKVDFYPLHVSNIIYEDGYYEIEGIKAKKLVLASGAYEPIVHEPYINLRGIWGHRIDISTTTRTEATMHHFVSISRNLDGKMAIGATHNVHHHPQKNKEPYNIEAGRKELLEKAAKTITLEDVKILQDYTGLRSGSNDYMPIIGKVIESAKSEGEIVYYPSLYMINGVGGYGFVLAPYIAKMLCDAIVNDTEIDKAFTPLRFYKRYKKKLLNTQ